MDPTNDLPEISTCTTCSFSEDFSNYWTAVVYFKHRNGTFERVSQFQKRQEIGVPHRRFHNARENFSGPPTEV